MDAAGLVRAMPRLKAGDQVERRAIVAPSGINARFTVRIVPGWGLHRHSGCIVVRSYRADGWLYSPSGWEV